MQRMSELGISGQNAVTFNPDTYEINYVRSSAPEFQPLPATTPTQSTAVIDQTLNNEAGTNTAGGGESTTNTTTTTPGQVVTITSGTVQGIEATPVNYVLTGETVVTPGTTTNWAQNDVIERWINSQGHGAAIERRAAIEVANLLRNNPNYLKELGVTLPEGTVEEHINSYLAMAQQTVAFNLDEIRAGNISPSEAIQNYIDNRPRGYISADTTVNRYIGTPELNIIREISGIEQGTTIPGIGTAAEVVQTAYPYVVQGGQLTVGGQPVSG